VHVGAVVVLSINFGLTAGNMAVILVDSNADLAQMASINVDILKNIKRWYTHDFTVGVPTSILFFSPPFSFSSVPFLPPFPS